MSQRIDISKLLDKSHLKRLQSVGLIDNIALRNLQIKSEYCQLRNDHSQINPISLLSGKYFLNHDSIYSILFRKRKMKALV